MHQEEINKTENEKGMPDGNTDENMSGTSHMNNELDESGELAKKDQEIADLRDKYLRLQAEFDNFRRRTAKEKLELMQTAGKDVIVSLLDILDDSERASKQMETATDLASVKDGSMMVFNKLKSSLLSKGLTEMDAMHQEFNPDLHDAITEIPAPTPDLAGKVLDVLQKGYYLNDKLIRHAKVVVGK
ncbi:nucleotide exchange factor GrpE [Chitinophaga sp. Cy-1792]|uniref:nucleotide exchange factor GrpE n=1 Tax=Chitinophaga sp. Cy-1792 TaxID=2608339 RepID=UPI0019635F58|nr:nucleotide exchange factor GrpE [Chitinophaga sp. Cy-1792]NIG53283.1 nucleotide exchange factor GrpE [Chitinophaga sp. Cy-1792]